MEYRDEYYRGFSTSDQRLFEHKTKGILFVFKWLFKALVFAPLLVAGYLLSVAIFGGRTDKLLLLVAAILFAFVFYGFITALKNKIYRLKANGHPFWLLFFLLFVGTVVALPVGLAYSPINYIVGRLGGNSLVSIAVTALFGYFVFRKYAKA